MRLWTVGKDVEGSRHSDIYTMMEGTWAGAAGLVFASLAMFIHLQDLERQMHSWQVGAATRADPVTYQEGVTLKGCLRVPPVYLSLYHPSAPRQGP